jgi:nucleoside-diphosphate-sugar epimerase
MERVLVTGATGFIGRHTLQPLLEQGFEVHGITSQAAPPSELASGYHWHSANLLDLSEIAPLLATVQPSHLLHLAWDTTPGTYWTSELNFAWVQSSLELLKQFQRYGGRRVVCAGTCAEYDWNYGYCSEDLTPIKPSSMYGKCKSALHQILEAYAMATDLSFAWGRVFFVYGPYEHPYRLVPSVINALLNEKVAPCSHGQQIRDFLYVKDMAAALVALLKSDMGEAVNLGSGQPIPLKHVIYKIADHFNRPDLIQLGAISPKAKEPALVIANNERLTKQVKWKPKFTLDDGLQETIHWWRSHKL